MKISSFAVSVVSLLIIAGLGFGMYKLFTTKPTIAQPPMPPSVVMVSKPVSQTIMEEELFTGTTAATQTVEIQARVEGYLQNIYFQDGSDVHKGDLLFEIEPNSFEDKRDQAVAALKSSEAELARAQSDFERVQESAKTNAVSQQSLTAKTADLEKARASVIAAQAALRDAELQLSYTKITSPIDGRISRRLVDKGNLVGSGNRTHLATIVQLTPIYVHFYVSENFIVNELQASLSDNSKVHTFSVGQGIETGYPHEGTLNYQDNTVDEKTGTVLLRGELPNEDKKLLPGMFVRVRVPLDERPNTLLVQDEALNTDLDGKYLLLVNNENIVERRPVKIGRQIDNMRVVLSGLSAGDSYITKGIQSVFSGSKVIPQFEGTQIQPDGNIR
jgi:RND family efflux transporter MFP subunit